MKLRRVLTTIAATVAALGTTLALASPVQASDSYHSMNTKNGAGSMSFTEHGDRVWLFDGATDGKGVQVNVFIGSHNNRYNFGVAGYGAEDVRTASQGGIFNLPENTTICFDIFLTDNGTNAGSTNSNCWYNDY